MIKDLVKYKPKDYVQLEVAAQLKAMKGAGKGKGKKAGDQVTFDYISIGEELKAAVAAKVVTYAEDPADPKVRKEDEARRHQIISSHMSIVQKQKNGQSPVQTGAQSQKTGRGKATDTSTKAKGKGKKGKGKDKGKGKGKDKSSEPKAKGKAKGGKNANNDWWTGRGSGSHQSGKGKEGKGKGGKK